MGTSNVTNTTTSGTKQDLVITRRFEAPVDLVWRAWSDPELVKQWWGPAGFTAPVAEIDFREGGAALLCMSSPQFGDNYSILHYQEIVPMERISYIHNLADKEGNAVDPVTMGMPPDFPRDQRHTITFTAVAGDQTELTITEHGWTVGQMMEMSRLGMEQCLDKMAAIFAKA